MLASALPALVAGCQSLPSRNAVPKDSSVLAVDVRFPFPLGRDPTLIRVYLAPGPIHAGMAELPPLVSTSFVKGSRAYLLDPEPGTYSLVAVAFDYAPPLHTDPALGVTGVVASGSQAGQTIVLSEEMILRTRTAIGHGMIKFMGALELRRGERIQAGTTLADALQQAVAERIHPGVTSETGLAGLLSVAWTLDRETSAFADDASVLDAFHRGAHADFGASPWASLLPAPEPERRRRRPQRAAREPRETAVAVPEPAAAPVPAPGPVPDPASAAAPTPTPTAGLAPAPDAPLLTAIPAPEPAPAPEPVSPRAPDPGVGPIAALAPPPGHPLATVELGMTSEEVEAILGDPDARERSRTRRAWIPFYTGPDAHRITWTYTGRGRVVFSVDDGFLEVIDVVYGDAATQ